jgi:hypothetical protein
VHRHFEAIWFANVANSILWWAFVKAWWRALITRLCCCCSRMARAFSLPQTWPLELGMLLHGCCPPAHDVPATSLCPAQLQGLARKTSAIDGERMGKAALTHARTLD